MKVYLITAYAVLNLSFLYSGSIGIYTGFNQSSFYEKKVRKQSLLQSLVNLNYFNFQYSINKKHSLNLEFSSFENKKSNISIQNRYNFLKDEQFYSGFSIGLNNELKSNLNVNFGSSFYLGNDLFIGGVSTIPVKEKSTPLINFYLGTRF